MVEAILRAMWPLLPMPLTTTRPLRPAISSIAATKRSSSRSASARTASASMARTRRASSSTLVSLVFLLRRAAFIMGPEYSPMTSLASVLVLLAAAVIAVALCRALKLPALVGYLVTGLALGPYALGFFANREETQHLAEFGVVFLMFSIGLEFSLGKLRSMRRVVFGLGGAQVLGTLLAAVAAALALGLSWQAGVALGGIVAMSSTAIVSRVLAERGEL